MRVLGIESSCDETGVALVETTHARVPTLLAHALHSQIAMHQAYGGVVPELASRDHIRRVLPLAEQVLAQAGATLESIDVVAYTRGPGLAGALLVGAGVACALGAALGKPVLGVHHLEGHLLSPFLGSDPPSFPFVALLVSGGHTQLMQVEGVGRYRLLGETIDDAAGEAFDKTAKLLGLGYPGGPALSHLAQQGDPQAFKLPRPLLHSGDLDFSFAADGEIIFNGKKFDPVKDVGHIGYMPEERGLYKKMKVGEQLIYFGRLKNLSLTDAKKRTDYWLGKMDLTAWKNSILMNLSKGMQQKVQFIASLLHDPQLIILDEPFSGFDPINSETITEIILELKQAGKTILFSTHRMETVESLCDHICLINNGQNILEGSLSNIKNRYKDNKFLLEGIGNIDSDNKNFILESVEKSEGNFIRAIITPHHKNDRNSILTEVRLSDIKIRRDFASDQ